MSKHHENVLKRAMLIQTMAAQHYEPGNYSRSYHQVWRLYVQKVFPMSYHTFLKYLNMDTSQVKARVKQSENMQLMLF